jgi:hypothetical protein
VKYSEFFEQQYKNFRKKLIGIANDSMSIYYYCWDSEFDKFNTLLTDKKLAYNDKIVGEDENWEYLLEYTLFFERGFNSINDDTPVSVIINNIPFCSTQKCINPEKPKSILIALGRKNSNSKPCIAGMRAISADSFFGEGLLRSIKINNVTQERVLKNPMETAYKEGIMFKSIFQVIERYIEFREYFEVNDIKTQGFVDSLLKGINELQTQSENADCIRQIKQNNKYEEAPFRDWFKTYLSGIYDSVNAEPEKGNGRIDLKIQDANVGTKIIEFKGWWNTDKKIVANQIMGYLTDFEEDGYIIIINHNKKKNITEKYLSLIKTKEMGYSYNTLEVKKYQNTGFSFYITKHFDGIRTKVLNHFILNVY